MMFVVISALPMSGHGHRAGSARLRAGSLRRPCVQRSCWPKDLAASRDRLRHGRVNDADVKADLLVVEVKPGTAEFDSVLGLAAEVQSQDRHLVSDFPAAKESHILRAFSGSRCVGFLRYLIQVIGIEEGRPAVMHNGVPLTEDFVVTSRRSASIPSCAVAVSEPRSRSARRGSAGTRGAIRCDLAAP
jgi:hypothetical protein